MDEKKLPCFGSHKVILVQESGEEKITYSINPDCEDCPQFRACRKTFLTGQGRYILDKLSEPPPVTPITDEDGTIRTVTTDYGLVDKFAFYFRDDLGFTWEQIQSFVEDFMEFAGEQGGTLITYEDFSKHFARFSYPSVDEKGFMLVVQVLAGERLFTEH